VKFYCIIHLPTKQYFPDLPHGSSSFEFNPAREHMKPPRLFRRESDARRYITEYCKGPKIGAIDGPNVQYDTFLKRNPKLFHITPVTLNIGAPK
jgi:hypothetical protein